MVVEIRTREVGCDDRILELRNASIHEEHQELAIILSSPSHLIAN